MRFESLIFERYGAFTDRELTLREGAQLHVVLGANEAGKTSALSAIGDLLFGFGHLTAYDFLHPQTTLRVGARIRLADGSKLAFWRRKGKGTKNTLRDEADNPLADDLLAPLLGSVTRQVFFSEFGLTAEALRAGGRDLLAAGGKLAETLAASSTQLSALARLRAKLEAEADGLFGARRAEGKEFYAALKQHGDASTRLRDAIVDTRALAAAEAAVEEAQEKRDSLNDEHDRQGRELARRERALRTREKLRRLDRLREELASLGDLPRVDTEQFSRWRGALEELERIDEQLARAQQEEAESAETMAALWIDQPLLAVGAKIDALREKLGAVRAAEEQLPRRRTSARAARDELDRLARRLGLAGCEALLVSQPTDAAIAHADDLIGKRADAERRLGDAEAALETARREQAALEQAEQSQGYCADPAPFLRRLQICADIPAEADRLRRDKRAGELERRRLEEAALRLDPLAGDPDDLARLALPEPARIEAAKADFLALEKEDKTADAQLKTLLAELGTEEAETESLSQGGLVTTRRDLRAARDNRERAYAQLGAALDGDPAARREGFAQLGLAHRQIDETTDALLTEAERAARLEAARERLVVKQHALKNLRAAREKREAQWRRTEAEWRELWRSAGVAPKAPQEMTVWRKSVDEVLQQRARLGDGGLELDALAQKLGGQRAPLTQLIADMGVSADPALPIEALYKLARAALDALQAGWTEVSKRVALRDRAAETFAREQQNKAKIAAEAERLLADWPGAMAAIGLDKVASPAAAKAALAIWREAPRHKKELEDQQHRVDSMQADIEVFEAETAELVAAAAPDLALSPHRESLDILSERLAASRAANAQRKALHEAAQKRETARAKLLQKRERTQELLAAARAALALGHEAPLGEAFELLRRRAECEKSLADAERDLLESGDGQDEATLRAEQQDLDFDLLPGDVERRKIDRAQLIGDITAAATALHDASRALEKLAEGRDAPGAGRDKAEAAAELTAVAARWLQCAAAARLAGRAIERHRAAVQDPLLARASELFAIATDGAFARLGADYDDGDAPMLVGLRASGARVPVAGMSEGARDQLFLALRLALLELRAAEPLPFIADDILASFDEARTARALGLIAEFGRARQPILFTHHRHVADIAAALPGASVDVIAL